MLVKVLTLAATALPAALAALPGTLELFAYSNGQQTGCINGYGNFTENPQWCYPFRSFVTTDPDSNLKGYDYCSVDTGVLNCYPGSGNNGIFHPSVSDLATDPTGTAFSIAALPADPSDNVGVPLIVGGGGSIPLVLNVKAVSG
ncbi:MAG: hypothetical protein MMC23_007744 [Stictis urceolatum]|nr:hypothetical protein [Stictis urceolata]